MRLEAVLVAFASSVSDSLVHVVNRQQESALPPPLRGTDPDSFTHHTIATRWPRIAQRVIDENDFPRRVNDRIAALRDDLPHGSIRCIDDPGAPDLELWDEHVDPHLGKSWLEAPWLFGEYYFYRRILEAIGYFQPEGQWRHDPFWYQKETGLQQGWEGIRALAESRANALGRSDTSASELERLVRGALWGNQADLSMWGAEEESPDHRGTDREHEHLLIDDTEAALTALATLDRPARIDVWADNAGFELVADLVLIDGFFASDAVSTVVVHLKVHPTFVSDATIDDVHWTLTALDDTDSQPVHDLSERLREAIERGHLRLRDDWVWTFGTSARDLPSSVTAELARSDLLISKGDANYRRLLGDRHWDPTTSFERAAAGLPVPVLALRTLKSEVVAGLSPEQVRRLEEVDPDWLVDGEWGVIQYAPTARRGDTEN